MHRRLAATSRHLSVFGETTATEPVDGPLVQTSLGPLVGMRHNEGDPTPADTPFSAPGTLAFLGVPYCKQPVPPRRFLPVEPLEEAWTTPRPCTTKPPIAPQPLAPQLADAVKPPSLDPVLLASGDLPAGQSEACCFLNVYAPADSQIEGKPRPVCVWFHGGGMTFGSTKLLDGSWLAKRADVIVITVQYRIGALGFLQPINGTTNLGILDQVESLRWIRREAPAFGGDPDNVCVFGLSSGGTCTAALLGCPHAEGLFHKAIVMSASPRTTTLAAVAAQRSALAEYLGWSDGESVTVERLNDLTPAQLLEAQIQLNLRGTLVVDGDTTASDTRVVMTQPSYVGGAASYQGALSATSMWFRGPLIIGCAGMEASSYGLEPVDCGAGQMVPKGTARPPETWEELTAGLKRLFALDSSSYHDAVEDLVARYISHANVHHLGQRLSPADVWHELTRDLTYGMFVSRLADAHARIQPRTFAYRSDRHVLRTEDPHHSLETSNTFGKFHGFLSNKTGASLTACVQGVSRQLDPAEIDEEAIALEARYISCWGQFAWHGDPNDVQPDQAVSSDGTLVYWPRRGVHSQVHIFDTPTCRVGGVDSLPGGTLFKWLSENELHEEYTLAKARIL